MIKNVKSKLEKSGLKAIHKHNIEIVNNKIRLLDRIIELGETLREYEIDSKKSLNLVLSDITKEK